MSASTRSWVQYAQLGISLLTPIVTGIIGFFLVRLGSKLERSKQLNQALLTKRLSFYEDVGPKLNDIYCFYQGIGHWSELNPGRIIETKRSLDRNFYVNRYLFAENLKGDYDKFIRCHFELYVDVAKPAKLRLDTDHLRRQIGNSLETEGEHLGKKGNAAEQEDAYERLMNVLAREVRGEPAPVS